MKLFSEVAVAAMILMVAKWVAQLWRDGLNERNKLWVVFLTNRVTC